MKHPNTYAEININNLIHNYKFLMEKAEGKTPICIVKADAYGHGAAVCAHVLEENGAEYFAVASIDEAEVLRNSGLKKNILILGYVPNERIDEVLEYNVITAVYSMKFARLLNEYALKNGAVANIHIKLNTGMNRLGFAADENCMDKIRELSQMKGLCIKGVFSHYACADEADKSFSELQRQRFTDIIHKMQAENIETGMIHISNSAGVLSVECEEANAFRPGIALYGISPFYDHAYQNEIKPVMTFLTSIANTYTLKAHDSLGYGLNYKTTADRHIAILCAGYADGYFRNLSNKADVFISGKRARICGNICMDMMAADISDIEEVRVGDKAELFGENISACELAEKIGSVPYEIMCSVSKRVKRIYIK